MSALQPATARAVTSHPSASTLVVLAGKHPWDSASAAHIQATLHSSSTTEVSSNNASFLGTALAPLPQITPPWARPQCSARSLHVDWKDKEIHLVLCLAREDLADRLIGKAASNAAPQREQQHKGDSSISARANQQGAGHWTVPNYPQTPMDLGDDCHPPKLPAQLFKLYPWAVCTGTRTCASQFSWCSLEPT